MKKILCYIFGHKFFKVAEHDNGRSLFPSVTCQRCGYKETFQHDYDINFQYKGK